MQRRQFLNGLGTLSLATVAGPLIGQPKIDPSRDPRMGFLGFGPQSETARIDRVLNTVTGYGERYGFRVELLSQADVETGKLREFGGFFVYGAGLTEGGDWDRLSSRAQDALSTVIKKRGAGLVALHEAAGIAPSSGPRGRNQARRSAWVRLIGGESIGALPSRLGRLRMADRSVPGMTQLNAGFELKERWLALKNFDPEVHVIMVQETANLEGALYERPAYPASWLRYHGKGRIFYSSLGYELDGWEGDVLRRSVVGGALWVLRDTEADVSSNLMRVTPRAIQAEYPV